MRRIPLVVPANDRPVLLRRVDRALGLVAGVLCAAVKPRIGAHRAASGPLVPAIRSGRGRGSRGPGRLTAPAARAARARGCRLPAGTKFLQPSERRPASGRGRPPSPGSGTPPLPPPVDQRVPSQAPQATPCRRHSLEPLLGGGSNRVAVTILLEIGRYRLTCYAESGSILEDDVGEGVEAVRLGITGVRVGAGLAIG